MNRIARCILLLFFSVHCADEDAIATQSTIVGLWVPYEVKEPGGISWEQPFTGKSIFGFYAESVQFNADGTYFPAVWSDTDGHYVYNESAGKYDYDEGAATILLREGQWNMDLAVTKFSNGEMWVVSGDREIRLVRRQE